MNLNKLFEAQRKLDERIVKEKGLENEDLLDKRILALLVELGELANEYRGFKFWSEDQNATTKELIKCDDCKGRGFYHDGYGIEWECEVCSGIGDFGYKNPLLEEYVDCLHFILSIGLEIGYEYNGLIETSIYLNDCITTEFLDLFNAISEFSDLYLQHVYEDILLYFHNLGKLLGFTWEEIEQAYYEKNKVNHERQESGY